MRRASMSLHTTTINTPALACANFSNAHHQTHSFWSTGTPTLLVIDQEVAAMKKAFAKIIVMPRFLVIIASKRHHVRFCPQSGVDKNANPLPGTLFETGVTQPFENDFYLCAHTAIKGTARPVHYNVLLNEPQWPQEKIHILSGLPKASVYHLTLPCRVLRPHRFPAVYYAHIASLRGAHHSKSFGNPAAYDNTVSNTTPATSTMPAPSRPSVDQQRIEITRLQNQGKFYQRQLNDARNGPASNVNTRGHGGSGFSSSGEDTRRLKIVLTALKEYDLEDKACLDCSINFNSEWRGIEDGISNPELILNCKKCGEEKLARNCPRHEVEPAGQRH
ncbi:hypothetical protein VTO58DRAFT_108361 [Aureobasidium pullulans]